MLFVLFLKKAPTNALSGHVVILTCTVLLVVHDCVLLSTRPSREAMLFEMPTGTELRCMTGLTASDW
eukprot:5605-Heterococcus_DN1.PRE.1